MSDPLVVSTFDAVLRVESVAAELRPEVVVHFGGLLASRVTNEWLASSGAVHLGFDRYGVVPDPDGLVADSFHVSPAGAAGQLRPLVERRRAGVRSDGGFAEAWRSVDDSARGAIDRLIESVGSTVTEPAVASRLLNALPDGSLLFASSSMPIRDLEWYSPPRHGVVVRANRGANGIDGVTSSAVGVALSGIRTACLLGDVAFVHDTNALAGLRGRDVDLLLVVVDNDGGGIFSFLPQADELDHDRFEQLFGTPHGTDLAGLALAHGLEVAEVSDLIDLDEVILSWLRAGGVRLVVVDSDRAANADFHRRLNAAVAHALPED